jgi:hypothetical protein
MRKRCETEHQCKRRGAGGKSSLIGHGELSGTSERSERGQIYFLPASGGA